MSAAILEYEAVPANFRVAKPTVGTISSDATLNRNPAASLPLFSFMHRGTVQRLTTPLMLRVSIENGQYFVENDSLRIFGHGDNLASAVEAFAHDLGYYSEYYRGLSDNDVAGDGIRLKRLYGSLLPQ